MRDAPVSGKHPCAAFLNWHERFKKADVRGNSAL